MDRQNKQLPITVFYSYASEDDQLQQELEKHLSILRQKGYIQEYHARQVAAGAEWKGVIENQLSLASVILLLISPDFLASDEYYRFEFQKAVELHNSGHAEVIPILLRPVDGIDVLLEHLQPLPLNRKPVTSWGNRDEAFSEIAHSIRKKIIQLHTQLNNAEHIPQTAKQTSSLFKRFSLAFLFALIQNKVLNKNTLQMEWSHLRQHKRPAVANIFILLLITLVLFLSLNIIRPSFCLDVFCQSITTRKPATVIPALAYDSYAFRNNDIKVSFAAFQSHFYVLTETELKRKQIPAHNEPRSIGAISMNSHDTSQSNSVVLSVESLYQGKYSIIINKVSIVVSNVIPIPRPLYVWEASEYPGYNENIYDVKYGGQKPGTEISGENTASHYGYVILSAVDPADHITVQVSTAIMVYLQFQIRLSYYRTDISVPVTVTLPGSFGIVFSNTTNWHQYRW